MPGWWRVGVGAVAVATLAVASHWLMLHSADRPWGALVILAPVLLLLAIAALRTRHAAALVAVALGVGLFGAALSAALARGDATELQRLYLLQHAGTHAALAVAFGLTLRRGQRALITRLAEPLHTQFTPAMRVYTRRLTAAWAAYFAAMALLSLLLYVLAPWAVWSVFANLVTPLATALFFVGEHVLRYRWHPDFEHVDVRHAIGAWRRRRDAVPATAAPTRPPPP
jgi:uncharacterized membrane protein